MKWWNILLRLVEQIQAAQAERDPIAGKPTKRSTPPTRRVDHGVRVEYTPDMDGEADPGEVVWAWVPYEDDPHRGKDRRSWATSPSITTSSGSDPNQQSLAIPVP